MTELLEKAVEAVRLLAPKAQDDIAHVLLTLARQEEPKPIEPNDLSVVLEGLARAGRGEFVSDAEVEAAFRRFS